eukprot:COSAG01_NODE_707_length_14133_cov_34.324093_10_plen_46_part_00
MMPGVVADFRVQVISYYGYANRLVAGLGVPFGNSSPKLVEGQPGL